MCKGEYTSGSSLVFVRDIEDIIDVRIYPKKKTHIFTSKTNTQINRNDDSFKTTERTAFITEFVVR